MRRTDRKDRKEKNANRGRRTCHNDRKGKNGNRGWSPCHPEVLRRICVVRRLAPDPSEYLRMTTIFNPSPAVTTPPNVPECPRMSPQNAIWQNEPTMAHLGAFGCIP